MEPYILLVFVICCMVLGGFLHSLGENFFWKDRIKNEINLKIGKIKNHRRIYLEHTLGIDTIIAELEDIKHNLTK